jgi:hypothetical protein
MPEAVVFDDLTREPFAVRFCDYRGVDGAPFPGLVDAGPRLLTTERLPRGRIAAGP